VTGRVCSEELRGNRKKEWGMFHLYLLISAALIIAVWGVIIRGGEPPPVRTAHVVERPTVLLFFVDTAIRRYAHHEERGYPEQLSDLHPKYVPLRKEELSCLEVLSYSTDPSGGYRLALLDRSAGGVIIMLSPDGIVQMDPSVEGS
jgi:hypothetical protein